MPSVNPDNQRLKQICFKHANAEVERRFAKEIARAEVVIEAIERIDDEGKRIEVAIERVEREGGDSTLLHSLYHKNFDALAPFSAERIEIQFLVTGHFDKIFRQCYERGLRLVR